MKIKFKIEYVLVDIGRHGYDVRIYTFQNQLIGYALDISGKVITRVWCNDELKFVRRMEKWR